MPVSLAEQVARLPDDERTAFYRTLTDEQMAALAFDWQFWRRPSQIMPDDLTMLVWAIIAGRGFGKTRTGAETVRDNVQRRRWRRPAIVGATAADVRDVMVEGPAGIMSISPSGERPLYEPSKRRLTWPNGATGTTYSAEEPDRLRGPEHDGAWCDEVAAWKRGRLTFENVLFGLRIGSHPQAVVTTTPKPLVWLRELLAQPSTRITSGSTYENRANLAEVFFSTVVAQYAGSRLGAQEIMGILLSTVEGALWQPENLEADRLEWDALPEISRIIVSVDPPGGLAAEAGIIVLGLERVAAVKDRRKVFILDDRSLRGTPEQWGAAAVQAQRDWDAEYIVAEVNEGHDMVRAVIHAVDPAVRVQKVHAKGSKTERAVPVAAIYDQHRAHHVGEFGALEAQMTTWTDDEDYSPDRMDALVHGVRDLLPAITRRPAQADAATGGGASSRRSM